MYLLTYTLTYLASSGRQKITYLFMQNLGYLVRFLCNVTLISKSRTSCFV